MGEQGKLVIVGQGYVGLPIAMRAVGVGYAVVGYDSNAARVKKLIMGESYVEDISNEELVAALASGRFAPTIDEQDCRDFDIAVITVPTPLREGLPDLSFVEQAGACLAPHLRRGAVVVLESTTYPGTTEELLQPILENGSGLRAGTDFYLGYSPERIDPGNKIWNLVSTPKVVSGINRESLVAIDGFYSSLVAKTVPVSSTRTAEMTKLIENTFRHVNIALVNELAMFAGDLGVDIWDALDAADSKPFGFMRFNPGPGVGGHCLPVDPSYLAWQVKRKSGAAFRFIELANDINDHMPPYVVRRLELALSSRGWRGLAGARVLLLGMAYKANTSDVREAPAFVVAEHLRKLGAIVRAVDPHVEATWAGTDLQFVELTEDEVCSADAVVVLTDHDCFDWDLVSRNARYVLDTRRRLGGINVELI